MTWSTAIISLTWVARLHLPSRHLADGLGALEKGHDEGMGLAYNSAVWAECLRCVPPYLREAGQKLGMENAVEPAAGYYDKVAEELTAIEQMFPFLGISEAQRDQNARDPELRSRAVNSLRAARDAEKKGVDALKELRGALPA